MAPQIALRNEERILNITWWLVAKVEKMKILSIQNNLSSIRLPFRSSMVSGVSTPVRTPEVIPDGVAKLKTNKLWITIYDLENKVTQLLQN